MRSSGYYSWGDSEGEYYDARREYNHIGSSPRKAGLFLYLNRLCFNGIYRTNRSGEFNVPYGGLRPVPRLSLHHLAVSADLLSRARLTSDDFEVAIDRWASSESFFFIDPPYFTSQKRIFREYGAAHFSACDLSRLARSLRLIDQRGGKFLLSYADVPEAVDLMEPWSRGSVGVTRHVGGFSGARRSERELVAANYDLSACEAGV
jgi:DNA adenine methylase